jgi:hypothetical protein
VFSVKVYTDERSGLITIVQYMQLLSENVDLERWKMMLWNETRYRDFMDTSVRSE